MKKLSLAMIPVAVILYVAAQQYADDVAAEKVDEAIAALETRVDVEYDDVSVGLVGTSLHMRDVVVSPVDQGTPIAIDELVLHDIDRDSAIPKYLDIELVGVAGLSEDALEKLGLEPGVKPNFELDYEYDAETRRLRVDSLAVELEGAGRITLALDLGNLALNETSFENAAMMAALVQLNGLRLQFEDDSLIERAIEATAERESTSPADVRTKIFADIDTVLASAKDDLSRQALSALREFIESPDHIAFEMQPKAPVTVASLGMLDPAEAIRTLNVRIE